MAWQVPLSVSKVSMAMLLVGLFLCCLLPATQARVASHHHDKRGVAPRVAASSNTSDNIANAAENEAKKFFQDTGDRFINTLKNLSIYIPISVEYAQTKGRDCDIIHNNREFYERVPLIISAVLIVLGVIYAFLGYRLIKIVLFLIGFLFGFAVVYIFIVSFTYNRPEHWIPYVALAGAGIAGILVGLLTICIYYIGIFLAGGSVGFLATWFILSLVNVEFFREHIYVPIIIAVVIAIVCGIIALVIQKWFFMLGTAILGGFIVVWGLDYYLELGSMIYYLFLFAEHRTHLKPCWYSWTMVPMFVILIVAGFLVQACVTGRKYNHKKEMKGVCCGLCKRKDKDTKSAPDGKANYMKLKSVAKD